MPYANTVNISFQSSGFTSNKPTFFEDFESSDRMKFANKTIALDLNSTAYGYAEFKVSYSGSVDFVYITFYQDGDKNVSFGEDLDYLLVVSNEEVRAVGVVKDQVTGSTKTFYVLVNTDQNNVSQILNIDVAVGKADTAPTDAGVKLEYNCTTPTYSYTMGLHVYSPYDARAGSSTLTTKLYSKTHISGWTTNTRVYSLPTFSAPALPYYYGYGSNVYKVGGELNRAYGTKKKYTVTQKGIFGKPQTKEHTIGPDYFYDSINLTSEACIKPLMSDTGLIKEIISNSSLSQPQSYRYYMGYDASNIRKSNDSVFTYYSFERSTHDPIVGSTHALKNIVQGAMESYKSTTGVQVKADNWELATLAIGASLIALGNQTIILVIKEVAGKALYNFLSDYFWRSCTTKFGRMMTQWGISSFAKYNLAAFLGPLFTGLGAALLAWQVYRLITKVFKVTIQEDCKKFLHKFTSTPYINTSNVIYNSSSLTGVTNGYYCDGVYYYTQSSNTVTNKELSYTYAIQLPEDKPSVFKLEYSLQADSPTLVESWPKLLVLPYLSGKPTPYCAGGTIYENTIQTTGFTPTCCDLERTGSSQTFTVPAGLYFSCTSQTDANNKALAHLQNTYSWVSNLGEYCNPLDNESVGYLETAFTHEIKVETYPTLVGIYGDITTGNIGVGKKCYYDVFGCIPVLNGYYAITGSTFYRKFYYITGGTVQSIHTMSTSGSTTTDTSQPIRTNNLDYTSNWYYSSLSANECLNTTEKWQNTKVNPNTLYGNSSLKKGFAKYTIDLNPNDTGITNQTIEDLQLYNNFTTTAHTEASTAWYRPLIDWIQDYPFYYFVSKTISLNIEEDCTFQTNSNVQRGFYIVGKSGSTVTPTINNVQLSINVFTTGATSNTLLDTFTVTTKGSENKTFVAFNKNLVNSNTKITNILIQNIVSPNPINKTTYNIGTNTLCLAANCDIKFSVAITGTTNTNGDNGIAQIGFTGGTGPYELYFDNYYFDTIPNAGTSTYTGLKKGVTYNFKVIDTNKCTNDVNFTVNGSSTITGITSGGTVTEYYTSDYIVLFCEWGTSHRFDFFVRAITPVELEMNIPFGKKQLVWYDSGFLSRYYPWIGEKGKDSYPEMPYFAYLSQYHYYGQNRYWPIYWSNEDPRGYTYVDEYGGKIYKPQRSVYENRINYFNNYDLVRPYMWFPQILFPDKPSERVGYHWIVIDVGAIKKDFYKTTGFEPLIPDFGGAGQPAPNQSPPGTHEIKIDCKGRWYGDYNLNNLPSVKLTATYWKDASIPVYREGTHELYQCAPYKGTDPRYSDPNYSKTINTPLKRINEKIAATNLDPTNLNIYGFWYDYNVKIEDLDKSNRDKYIKSGERIATLNLNLQTGAFNFNTNDSTPSL